jgi:succinate dehydrogenase / fumarate reductase, cytochrome b subunit
MFKRRNQVPKQDQRPVFLSIHKIRLPLNALVSIFHRVSGLVMFLSLPWVLCALSHSLSSAQGYSKVQAWLYTDHMGFVTYVVLLAWVYHAVAGLRHLVMDMGWGESLAASRLTSMLVLAVTAVCAYVLGVWIW